MRKYQKAAVVMAMLGSVSFLGAGASHADGEKVKLDNKQGQKCSADESNKTGAQVIEGIPVNLSVIGVSEFDNSKRKSVHCTQVFTIGR